MKPHLKPSELQIEIANAFRKGPDEGRAYMQRIARGEIVPIRETGQPIDFSPGPTHCVTAPVVEITRDQFGRTKRITPVEPAKVDAPSPNGAPRLSPEDQYSFDRMKERFARLPDGERRTAMDALVQAALPRLIHD